MATKFTPTPAGLVRRVAVGDCSRSQGADGVEELALTAHQALLAAAWTPADAAAMLPVHDMAQPFPLGDAFKCCYGYDATARTERAAAGAACYSWRIPQAALDGGAAISLISVRLVGDRYLDQGARLYAAVTASAIPPPLPEMLETPVSCDTVLATCDQFDGEGKALAPNARTGERADVQLSPEAGSPLAMPGGAAVAYLHLCLALVDYTAVRGAWIEGGAMLVADTLQIEFDRDVAASACEPQRIVVAPRLAAADSDSSASPVLERDESCLVWRFRDGYAAPGQMGDDPAAYVDALCAAVRTGAPTLIEGCYAVLPSPSVIAAHEFGLGALAAASGDLREVRATLSRVILPTTETGGRGIDIEFPDHASGSGVFYAAGLGRLRVLVFDGETAPDFRSPAHFAGSSSDCCAAAETETDGALTLRVPFRRAVARSLVWIVCLPLGVAPGHAAGAAWGALPESLYLS